MDEVVARAIRYPYERPTGSYVFDTRTGTYAPVDPATIDGRDRHARLAIGSNASPYRLAQKFAWFDGAPTIPVIEVALAGYDVVYAALIASYGSVPATLVACRDVRVSVHVTLLDAAQCKVMDDGEAPGYRVEAMPAGAVDARCALPRTIGAYVARAGPMHVNGAPVALAAIAAERRSFPAMTEREALALLAAREEFDLATFVRRVVDDADYRRAISAELRAGLVRRAIDDDENDDQGD